MGKTSPKSLEADPQTDSDLDKTSHGEVKIWVDSVVTKTDDPSTPAFTIRAVFQGIIWACFLAIANALFSFRANPFVVPTQLALLLSYPIGIFMEKILPDINILGAPLNPGPFSVKEHALIYIIAGSAGGSPYGIDNVVTQKFKMFMNNTTINFWNSLPWILATQFIGYGVAGITRRYLVKPAAMMWPSVLPTVALLNSFHGSSTEMHTKKYPMSRYTFFWIVFALAFIWELVPLYFAPAFATVSILCFFSNNRTIKVLGSSAYQEGLGIFSLSFDWSTFQTQYPLYTPFWAACNYFGSAIFFGWILTPIVHYNNYFGVGPNSPGDGYLVQSHKVWGGDPNVTNPQIIPNMNSNKIFDINGTRVNVDTTGLLNPDYTLNEEFYDAHKPFYLTAMFTMAYFASFMNIAATFTHVLLWNGKDVYRQFKEALHQADDGEEDELNVLMREYSEVPDSFYAAFLVVFVIIQILSGIFTEYKMPWWSSLFAVALGSVYVVPIGVIQAVSGFQMGLNVLTEFLIGLLTPGDTIGVMCFKSLGYNMVIQALNLLSDLKQGHYQHISPFYMFLSQMIGTFIGAVLNLGTVFWAEEGLKVQFAVEDGPWNPQANYGTFVSAGGIWGAIGPARFFGIGSPYSFLLYGFGIGFALPFIPWLLNKAFPSPKWELINFPLLTVGPLGPGPTLANVTTPFFLNFVFNKLIFTYRREWWEKYNFILGIALDSATAIALLVVTFVQFFGPDYSSVGPYPFAPSASVDYYCFEQFFNGSYISS